MTCACHAVAAALLAAAGTAWAHELTLVSIQATTGPTAFAGVFGQAAH